MARSPKLRLRPYQAGDEDAFELRGDFAEERAATAWDWSKGPPGPTWTLTRWDEAVLGVAGAVDHGDDVWRVWAQLADLPKRDWSQALWLAGRVLTYLETQRGATVIEAEARAANPAAIASLRRLGFSLGRGDPVPHQVAGVHYVALVRRA